MKNKKEKIGEKSWVVSNKEEELKICLDVKGKSNEILSMVDGL